MSGHDPPTAATSRWLLALGLTAASIVPRQARAQDYEVACTAEGSYTVEVCGQPYEPCAPLTHSCTAASTCVVVAGLRVEGSGPPMYRGVFVSNETTGLIVGPCLLEVCLPSGGEMPCEISDPDCCPLVGWAEFEPVCDGSVCIAPANATDLYAAVEEERLVFQTEACGLIDAVTCADGDADVDGDVDGDGDSDADGDVDGDVDSDSDGDADSRPDADQGDGSPPDPSLTVLGGGTWGCNCRAAPAQDKAGRAPIAWLLALAVALWVARRASCR